MLIMRQFQWKNEIGIMSNLKNVKKKYRWKCIVRRDLLPCKDNNLSKRELWVREGRYRQNNGEIWGNYHNIKGWLREKDYCVAKVTAVMPVITAVSTMSLSHCVWLRKASTVSVPGGLARSSICRVHYKPTFPLSSSMHRCRPFNNVSNSCTQHSQLNTSILLIFFLKCNSLAGFPESDGKKSFGRNNSWTMSLQSLFSCFPCISCFYLSNTCT